MFSKIRKFFAMDRAQQALLLKTLRLLIQVKLLLRLQPVPRIREAAKNSIPPRPPTTTNNRHRTALQIFHAITSAARVVPGGATCLPRAIVAERLLCEAGLPSEFFIGVRKDQAVTTGNLIEAHAWVQSVGYIYPDSTNPDTFTPLWNSEAQS